MPRTPAAAPERGLPSSTRTSSPAAACPSARVASHSDGREQLCGDRVAAVAVVPTRSDKLSEWLPYWRDNVIKPRRKLSTYDKYETHVRLYLVPMLGAKRLESLGVADVRRFLVRLEKEATAATAKESRRVLRSALSSACREELITRNVAKLVEPPRT